MRSNKDTAKDMLPTRPQYIRNIITNFDSKFKSLVIPVVIPTVLIAEVVSKTASVMLKPCKAQSTVAPKSRRSKLVDIIITDFRRTSSLIRLL